MKLGLAHYAHLVDVKHIPAATGISHQRFAVHERPSATVTAVLRWARHADRVEDARIAVGAVGFRPARATQAERGLLGASHADLEAQVTRAAESAAEVAEAVSDDNGSADYKVHLVQVLVKRAVLQASQRADA